MGADIKSQVGTVHRVLDHVHRNDAQNETPAGHNFTRSPQAHAPASTPHGVPRPLLTTSFYAYGFFVVAAFTWSLCKELIINYSTNVQ